MKLSEWQDGVPPSDGIWEIHVPEHEEYTKDGTYFARYRDGQWGAGYYTVGRCQECSGDPYPSNNQQCNPRKWRGQIEE